MNPAKRLFLIVFENHTDGLTSTKPSMQLRLQDPANDHISEPFVSSPIFSLNEDGNSILELTEKKLRISFFIVPKFYPIINELPLAQNELEYVWFSIGIANIIVIENEDQNISSKLEAHLREVKNCIGVERWNVNNGKIDEAIVDLINFEPPKEKIYCGINLSKELPLHLEFGVFEYILSANKLLNLAYKYIYPMIRSMVQAVTF